MRPILKSRHMRTPFLPSLELNQKRTKASNQLALQQAAAEVIFLSCSSCCPIWRMFLVVSSPLPLSLSPSPRPILHHITPIPILLLLHILQAKEKKTKQERTGLWDDDDQDDVITVKWGGNIFDRTGLMSWSDGLV